jgi:outer membrane protein OmpA-like peptidoglycan-associated protein
MIFTFFISSVLLLFIAVEKKSYEIYTKQNKKMRISKIQIFSKKAYSKTRKFYIPEHSLSFARKKIENILLKEPISFEVNDSSILGKSTLIKVVKIINKVKEDVVLSISAHTDVKGIAKHNLYLSQKRADRLKEYFLKKTNLPLIVAIGYGEAFSLENRLIEINLRRIK